jgi:hypothetical protein
MICWLAGRETISGGGRIVVPHPTVDPNGVHKPSSQSLVRFGGNEKMGHVEPRGGLRVYMRVIQLVEKGDAYIGGVYVQGRRAVHSHDHETNLPGLKLANGKTEGRTAGFILESCGWAAVSFGKVASSSEPGRSEEQRGTDLGPGQVEYGV